MSSANSSQPTAYTASQFNQYTVSFEGNSVACILIGIYFTIAGTNLYLLRRKRQRALAAYTIVQLALTTLYFTLSLYSAPAISLSIFDISNSYTLIALSPWSSIIVSVTFILNTWTSDAFLLYRCHVICQGNKYMLAFLVLLYLAVFGSSLAWLVVSSQPGTVYTTHTVYVTGICYWSCSTAMTVCASCIITARLWLHRKELSNVLGSQNVYLGYVAIALESALLYTTFAVVALVVFAINGPLKFVFIPVLGMIQAIAPSLIIYRIARGISFDSDKYGPGGADAINSTSSDGTRINPSMVHRDMSHGSAATQAKCDDTKMQFASNSSVHEIRIHI